MADRNSTTHPTRVAIYARVSTSDQSTDPQLLDLRKYVSDRGWTIYREYRDEGISERATLPYQVSMTANEMHSAVTIGLRMKEENLLPDPRFESTRAGKGTCAPVEYDVGWCECLHYV